MGWLVDAILLLSKGGYVMVPLMVCSVASVAILIERFVRIRAAEANVKDVIKCAEDAVYDGKPDRAVELLDAADVPVSRVLAWGVRNRHLGERAVERAMEEQAAREVSFLNRGLSVLDTIVTIAPLLGLLGTVTGMISAFHVIAAKEGISTPTAITGGVAEALIATATGLAVAIFTLIGHNYLQERIKHLVTEIESSATGMVNVIMGASEVRDEVTWLSA